MIAIRGLGCILPSAFPVTAPKTESSNDMRDLSVGGFTITRRRSRVGENKMTTRRRSLDVFGLKSLAVLRFQRRTARFECPVLLLAIP